MFDLFHPSKLSSSCPKDPLVENNEYWLDSFDERSYLNQITTVPRNYITQVDLNTHNTRSTVLTEFDGAGASYELILLEAISDA